MSTTELTDIENCLHERVNAIECSRLPIVSCNLLIEESADVLGLFFENWFDLPDVVEGKGVIQHLAMSLMLSALHQNQAMAGNLLRKANEPIWLCEGIAILVQDVFVCCDAVGHENFIVEEPEIANERRFWMFFHPFDVQRCWRWCAHEIYELAKEEMIVLDHWSA